MEACPRHPNLGRSVLSGHTTHRALGVAGSCPEWVAKPPRSAGVNKTEVRGMIYRANLVGSDTLPNEYSTIVETARKCGLRGVTATH